MTGHAFVSYAHEDRERVRPLVDHLTNAGIIVFWDEQIAPGVAWRQALEEALDRASCTIVVWSNVSVQRPFVRAEAARGEEAGTLVPVKIDAEARPPLPFGEHQYVDLTGSIEAQAAGLQRLLERVETMASEGRAPSRMNGSFENNWVVANSRSAIDTIRGLTRHIRTLGEVLTLDAAAAADVKGALDEVGKTYRVVNQAIQDFLRPALRPPPLDGEPYLVLERSLMERIRSGRGHCGQIAVHYGRYGGVRETIARTDTTLLDEADHAFGTLSLADGDLFAQLEQIGALLKEESRVVVNLLLAGEEDAARQRIALGHSALQPLEDDLAVALQELQELETVIGYVPRERG